MLTVLVEAAAVDLATETRSSQPGTALQPRLTPLLVWIALAARQAQRRARALSH